MSDKIRAMSFGETMDVGFRIMRERFAVLAWLTLIGYLPVGLLMMAAGLGDGNIGDPAQFAASMAGVLLFATVVMPVVMAAVTHVAGQWLLDRDVELASALRFGVSIYLPMVGTFFLWYVAFLGIFLIVGLGFAAIGVAGPLGVVAAGAGAWVGGWLGLGLMLVPTVAVLERVFGLHPMRRSWELLEGHRWRALGIVAVVWVISAVVQGALVLPTLPFPAVSPIAQYLGGGIAQVFSTAVFCALYVDVRCRNEGFDLEHLAQQVGTPEAEPAGAQGATPERGW